MRLTCKAKETELTSLLVFLAPHLLWQCLAEWELCLISGLTLTHHCFCTEWPETLLICLQMFISLWGWIGDGLFLMALPGSDVSRKLEGTQDDIILNNMVIVILIG